MQVAEQMHQRVLNPQVRAIRGHFNSFEDVERFVTRERRNCEDDKQFDAKRHKILFLFILGEDSDQPYSGF
jgi:hypothetical protein